MKPVILVKLKMKRVYKMFLCFISLLIFVSIGIGVVYLSFDKLYSKESDIDVNGSISINYISGKKFKINGDSDVKFTVTNSDDKPSYYTIKFLNVRGNGTYKLYNDDELVTEGEFKSTDEQYLIDISIDGKSTENFTVKLASLSEEEEISGTLNIRVQESKTETFADLIIKDNSYGTSSLTKVGSEVAVENEGLIKDSDDLGVTYYFRGNVNNNYVIFDDLTWRIMRINGDGTVRLILDRLTSTVANYYTNEDKNFDYESSEISKFLETWYQDNIKSKDLIANTKYCSDLQRDDDVTFNAYSRIMVNYIPTFNCLGRVISDHIGLPTIDEVVLAGANSKDINQNFYLYNKNIDNVWYTMSGAKGNEEYVNMFMVNPNGSINILTNGNLYRGVRPVINLVKNIEMQGKGTIEEPYTIVD